MGDFKLSATLKGHEDDVRDVVFANSNTVISASRDATVRRWLRNASSQPPVYDDSIVSHGQSFVNAVTFVPSQADFPDGLIVSGGKDCIVEVRQPGGSPAQAAERLLLGHEGNICSLDVGRAANPPFLVSGSWDSSALVWDFAKGESTATLGDHTGSVWGVLAYDANTIITGCADHTIRVFGRNGQLKKTIKGSKDVVRALCRLPDGHPSGAQFASAGNDMIIRLWTLQGKEVAQLHGHENFIYSLSCLPSGEIISSSEDRSVRIWKNTQCIQTITHPAISVWCVAADPDSGDIATGASDRIVRVFTRSQDRIASEEALQAFENSVKESSIPQQSLDGQINKEKLPGPEFLQQKSGTKEGQVQMIREANGNISAHQWSNLARQWVNVGTVVDAQGSTGRKQEYQGQDYDYVFDVDIEDGKPPLKLPYNLSQNPYEVARKFIADNELPLTYLDQVANFIVQNTQGATIGQQSGSTGSAPAPTQPRPKVLPQKDYLTITTVSLPLIHRKVQELNGQLVNDGRKDVSISPPDLKAFGDFMQLLEPAMQTPNGSHDLGPGVQTVIHMATQWPPDKRIPGMDLLRCVAAADRTLVAKHELLGVLNTGAFDSGDNLNLVMLAIRCIVNLYAHSDGQEYAWKHRDAISALVGPQLRSGTVNRNVYVASTTIYINFAVQLHKTVTESGSNGGAPFAQRLLSDLVTLLKHPKVVDAETVYRALVGVGTLVLIPGVRDTSDSDAKNLAKDVDEAVKEAARKVKEPRVRGLVDEMTGR